jgi:hypothetical protein
MIYQSERWRKQYSENPEFRARVIASSRSYQEEHKREIQDRHAHRMRTDPKYRDKKRAS